MLNSSFGFGGAEGTDGAVGALDGCFGRSEGWGCFAGSEELSGADGLAGRDGLEGEELDAFSA